MRRSIRPGPPGQAGDVGGARLEHQPLGRRRDAHAQEHAAVVDPRRGVDDDVDPACEDRGVFGGGGAEDARSGR